MKSDMPPPPPEGEIRPLAVEPRLLPPPDELAAEELLDLVLDEDEVKRLTVPRFGPRLEVVGTMVAELPADELLEVSVPLVLLLLLESAALPSRLPDDELLLDDDDELLLEETDEVELELELLPPPLPCRPRPLRLPIICGAMMAAKRSA